MKIVIATRVTFRRRIHASGRWRVDAGGGAFAAKAVGSGRGRTSRAFDASRYVRPLAPRVAGRVSRARVGYAVAARDLAGVEVDSRADAAKY